MEDAEQQLWCEAWRFLQRNGEDSERLIELEIERGLKSGDRAGADHWRQIADAVAQLRI